MKKAKKIVALLLCAVLLMGATIAGTVAYLTDSKAVTNTFTVGQVSIDLKEYDMDPATGKLIDKDANTDGVQKGYATFTDTDGFVNVKLIPGRKIEKQPVVILNEGCEKCWLFVKVEGAEILGVGSFTCASGWSAVDGADGWYQYSTMVAYNDAEDAVNAYQVFEDFTVASTLSGDAEFTNKGVAITAYAIQAEEFEDNQTGAFEIAEGMATGA